MGHIIIYIIDYSRC